MHTLIVTLLIGTFSIQTDNLEACKTAGFNLILHDQALHGGGGTDNHFYCVNADTGSVWANTELPQSE